MTRFGRNSGRKHFFISQSPGFFETVPMPFQRHTRLSAEHCAGLALETFRAGAHPRRRQNGPGMRSCSRAARAAAAAAQGRRQATAGPRLPSSCLLSQVCVPDRRSEVPFASAGAHGTARPMQTPPGQCGLTNCCPESNTACVTAAPEKFHASVPSCILV